MEYKKTQNGILILKDKYLDLDKTLGCGQAFRWIKRGDSFIGVVEGEILEIEIVTEGYKLKDVSAEHFEIFWRNYFDLDRDYETVYKILLEDEMISTAVNKGLGIRILNQNFWEILISFILSANNNIPRIKKIIEKLSVTFGVIIEKEGNVYHAFPSAEALANASEEELLLCGCGYRASYVNKTAQLVLKGAVSIEKINAIDYSEAVKLLLTCPGVGPKVADCILLFSTGKTEAFPVDVWIRKAMERFFGLNEASDKDIKRLGQERYGKLAGFAQQYIFYNEIS